MISTSTVKSTDDDVTSESSESNETKKLPEPDGSINRLREERRDLYDLLYGDDSSGSEDALMDLGDENLDTFDPYGLDDF